MLFLRAVVLRCLLMSAEVAHGILRTLPLFKGELREGSEPASLRTCVLALTRP
jgi:hypothetical protein